MRTPGPWRVEDGGFVGGPAGFGRVCQFWNKFEEDFRNADDNAYLVSAAPDLLVALKAIMADIPKHRDWLDPVAESMAHAAIAKAEGRS